MLGDVAGTYAPILNFNYDAISGGALIVDDSNAIVYTNASITHSATSTTKSYNAFLNIQSGNLTLNGTINVTGTGYPAGTSASSGTGHGNLPSGNASGAGYGGEGGDSGGPGGITYGLMTAPTDLGSGAYGSSGGGAVQLTIGGTLTVSGSITANGNGGRGGGSGGSVYITTGTLSGAGTIAVNGGVGTRFHGSGGGGRIAVYYTTDSSTITYTAYGPADAYGYGHNGAAGTIYKKPASGAGSVVINNNNVNPNLKVTGEQSFNGLTLNTLEVKDYGRLLLSSTATISTLTLSSNAVIQFNSGGM